MKSTNVTVEVFIFELATDIDCSCSKIQQDNLSTLKNSYTIHFDHKLHGPSMFAIKAKIYEVLYKQSSSIAFDETLVIGQRLKTPNFSAFHWSPHGSLVSIGQNFVTTRVVHLPKRTETSLITESDKSGPNHQLLQLCMARTAWSSCISWF